MTFRTRMRILPLDLVAIGLVLAAVVWSGWMVYRPGQGRPVIQIEGVDGRQYATLERNALIRVHGPLGDTVVEVHDGKVRVKASPCDNQTCVHAGDLDPEHGWTACLPNRVFVRVGRGATGGVIRAKERPSEREPDARIW